MKKKHNFRNTPCNNRRRTAYHTLRRFAVAPKLRPSQVTNVLILCTHNSARSVLSEAMLNYWAEKLGKNVRAYSAGSAPSGRLNPHAIAALDAVGVNTDEFRSKSWDEFTGQAAPHFRIVITVCDSAARESCPRWPGSPINVHWGYPDPSNAPGSEADKQQAFELTRQAIGYRMLQLLNLPLDQMDDFELKMALEEIYQR